MSSRFAPFLLLAALLPSGCSQALNYADPHGPRFAGNFAPAAEPKPFDGTLDVVTLNIQFSRHIDRAEQLFDDVKELRQADVVLLQEMDAAGTGKLAGHLGMVYVYYPATVHPKTDRDFGNAVLSRWPIASDRKIGLPHHGIFDGSQRTATCATVETPVEPVEVCSMHLATPLELFPGARLDQVRAVVQNLGATPRIVVGGDMNSHGLGELLTEQAFEWPTERIGGTRGYFSVDHIFARGLHAKAAGKVEDTLGATDHAAVWTTLVWPDSGRRP